VLQLEVQYVDKVDADRLKAFCIPEHESTLGKKYSSFYGGKGSRNDEKSIESRYRLD
jgi:hypothetical protein